MAADFFNSVRRSFCDYAITCNYVDKSLIALCVCAAVYVRSVCDGRIDWQTDVNMALLPHSSYGFAAFCRKDSQNERRGVVFLDEAQRSSGSVMQ